ncbi:MAG: HisA/HisF-related TIM barrel protein [Alphaproteobacteria bacterium]|nr:HisA/HisF-related TIM barrel protein [Alphaproteobacteria bacterium]
MPNKPIEIIPVLDLKGGLVVRARQGLRHAYRPIQTPLSPTSTPTDIVAGLLTIFPFPIFYIADLDRIDRYGDHDASLTALSQTYPRLEFWVDAGVSETKEARDWLARHPRAHLVLGSESLKSLSILTDLAAHDRILLSMDFQGDRSLGPKVIHENPQLWPRRIIAMTLARVGSGRGPDIDRLMSLRRQAEGVQLYAAGGVRGNADLNLLRRLGVNGALVASALHEGRLTAQDLATGLS